MADILKLTSGMTKDEIAAFVDRVLPELTLKEKVSLMAGREMNKLVLGASVLFFRQFNRWPALAGGIRRFGIPPVKFSDGPRGVAMDNATCFPVAMARGASWDLDLQERIGEAIGREIRALGGNYYGGVCVNLLRHPAWGRAQETYGEDPHLLGEMGAAMVRGVQRHNVMACVKHYALNNIEQCRFKVDVRADERTLREVYLAHFRRCVEQGAASVMGAYNKFRGEYCCQNAYLLAQILREEWGFDGFCTSDWVWGIRDTVKAVESGMDVEMLWPKFYGRKLVRAVADGRVSVEAVDRAARNILLKVCEVTSAPDPQSYDKSLVACQEHADLALEAAEKGMVLLKNEGQTLPFSGQEIKTLAVVGRLAAVENTGDHGSSRVVPRYTITALQGLEKHLAGRVLYADGSDLDRACHMAAAADAVVVVAGYDYRDEGEHIGERFDNGSDRLSLRLHDDDVRLIEAVSAANTRCVVALVGGSAIVVEEWVDSVPAVLMAWYGGQEGGRALARILFGKVNPSGKLPFTVPVDPQDLPFFDRDADEIKYGYYHGYTLFDRAGIEPAYPFGFGLSYTSFAYGELRLSASKIEADGELTASIEVSNTGDRRWNVTSRI
jgi:beta-glucosidase